MQKEDVIRDILEGREIRPGLEKEYYKHVVGDVDLFVLTLKKIPLTSDIVKSLLKMEELGECFKVLLSIDLPPYSRPGEHAHIVEVLQYRSAEEFRQALTIWGSESRLRSGATLLHYIAYRMHDVIDAEEKFHILLEYGVDPLQCDNSMKTPLYYCHPKHFDLFTPYVSFDGLSPSAKREGEPRNRSDSQYIYFEVLMSNVPVLRKYLDNHGCPRNIYEPFSSTKEAKAARHGLTLVLFPDAPESSGEPEFS